MTGGASPASRLVGPNPTGALGRVSLAVRNALAPLRHEPPTTICVGFSGGADSLALTAAAVDICSRWGIGVEAVTVDHGLRDGSSEEALRVKRLAESLGAVGRVVRVDVSGGPGGDGPEAGARNARLDALRTRARATASGPGSAPVLLGHTMDDQAETVLLRLARGSGAGSLRAMNADSTDEAGVRWIRPLLSVRRADTRGACRQLGLDWIEDPTNDPDGPWRAADGSALRRAAVRAYALPARADALGVDPVPALARTAQLAAADDAALDQWADSLWPQVELNGGCACAPAPASCARISASALVGVPQAVASRLVHRMALAVGARAGDLSAEHLSRVLALARDWHGQGPVDLPGARALREGRAGRAMIAISPIR